METFQQVYEENAKKVYHFLLALIGNEQQAEEILQETFYQAFLHINQFQGRSSVYTWLCQIGKNAWYKECSRKKRWILDSEKAGETREKDTELSMEDTIIRKEECDRIRQATGRLAEPYRNVFCLHIFGEVKLKEIAKLYGKSESWARVTYYRAKGKILEEVER